MYIVPFQIKMKINQIWVALVLKYLVIDQSIGNILILTPWWCYERSNGITKIHKGREYLHQIAQLDWPTLPTPEPYF